MEQITILDIEREGTEPGKGSPIPSKRWFNRDDTKKWLENLRKDDEGWYDHLQREKEYQERKQKDYHY